MLKKVSVVLFVIFLLYSCQAPFGSAHHNKVSLDVSAWGKGLLSFSTTQDTISSITVTITDNTGSVVTTLTMDPASTTEDTVDLESGKTFDIAVSVSIRGANKIARVWNHSETFAVPSVGNLELPIVMSAVSLDTPTLSLAPGDPAQLKPTIQKSLPSDTTSVVWSTSDANVATVTPLGVVTAVAEGPATIYAIPSDNGLGAACAVTVSKTAATTTTTTTSTTTTTTTIASGVAFWNDTWATAVVGGNGNYTPTQSVTPDGTKFLVTLNYSNGGDSSGTGVPTQTWTFTATAQQTGTIYFNWTYNGFHGYSGAYASLSAWTNATGSTVTNPLQANGSVSNNFTFSGTSSIDVHQGQTYGFTVTGGNGDSTSILNGSVTITAYLP